MKLNQYLKTPRFRVRKFNRKNYLFNGEKAYELNSTALEIYRSIGKGYALEDILERVGLEITEETVSYSKDFINFLLENKIIVRVDDN
ncbi:hypothetical protein Si114_01731 [Streptococcus infantarius subsp. infantarius]|nr:hypothetical protein [Streptococcus infantarius subsp. infantarius]MCO4518497.1 hypothetical protein [Streptococcus infantarius subsp. infantarius]MCO4524544.1 hypothetical protein [Streptococcus infantarius subsp. infantarius]